MKTTIKISPEDVEQIAIGEPITNYLYKRLIEQEEIDTNFYDVQMEEIEILTPSYSESSQQYGITYRLNRIEDWNDLSECEERLRIGL